MKTIKETRPKAGDEWHTKIGHGAKITAIQPLFYGSPDPYPVKGYIHGTCMGCSWTYQGIHNSDPNLNLTKLHYRENVTEDRRDDSLEFFRSVMDPGKPTKSVFDLMRDRERQVSDTSRAPSYNQYGYVVRCGCGCEHLTADDDYQTCKYCGRRYR